MMIVNIVFCLKVLLIYLETNINSFLLNSSNEDLVLLFREKDLLFIYKESTDFKINHSSNSDFIFAMKDNFIYTQNEFGKFQMQQINLNEMVQEILNKKEFDLGKQFVLSFMKGEQNRDGNYLNISL